jgi:hypothetical protein
MVALSVAAAEAMAVPWLLLLVVGVGRRGYALRVQPWKL